MDRVRVFASGSTKPETYITLRFAKSETHTHRMTTRRITRAYFFALFLAVATLPVFARAAELSFSPASGTFTTGKEFSVKVLVNPGVDSINAADGQISFDTSVLSVSSVSKDGSAFSLWTADPAFSNSAGTIDFSGGTPSAFSKSGTVLTIKFKGKKTGSGKVTFTKGSVLAADGKGTNVYSKGGEATYVIEEGKAAEPPPPAAADETPAASGEAFGGSPPIAPNMNSLTHPKPESYYGTSTVRIDWKIPPDVIGIRMLFTDKDSATPNVVLKPDVASSTQLGVADGTWYFYLQFKNEAGWGEVGKRKVMIDTVLPEEFQVALLDQGDDATAPKLTMKTTDDVSGMDRYEIYFNDTSVGTVKDADVGEGFPIPPQAGGPTKVKVKAYDKAGNIRESEKELTLPLVAKPVKGAKAGEVVPVQGFFTTERILLMIFTFIIGILTTVNMYSRKASERDRLHILQEVAQVRDKNDKIFSAMREEFEQMVQDLDEKPQLTPTERDLLERIKEVLEVSEEIVDTGMDTLKKTIRG